ncbi:glycerophosphodiester phosphodiesterase family protein [Aureimonas ureilytica]|uniref:glycerophosphodiester phosphodiesterase family protein n=1 Tax=Aureimonas ureilytica TaxID=401562 RepID=UPI000374B067|nr:glycerophosphodiester phosphodiesterase family protein [Aureimonas ureilytica]
MKAGWLKDRPIAHRGLHDGNKTVFENSISAFRAAIAGGYAIECDVHLSSDGVPVVFHDDDLKRLTGREGRVRQTSAVELGGLRLGGTGDTIPTLAALLQLVAGQVPLVVELKGASEAEDAGFVDAVAAVVEGYAGPLALMSFDSWLLEQTEQVRETYPIGLTAEGTRPELLAEHRAIFARRCDFTSYNIHHLPNDFVDWVRNEQGAPAISWTVRTPAEAEKSARLVDQMTFEGFTPPR